MKETDERISRRSFLERGAVTIVGTGVGLSSLTAGVRAQEKPSAKATPEKEAKAPMIKEYRDLGNTGWKVSDLGFGNAMMKEPSLLEYAIERGINYIDTGRQYYDMEVVVGKIFPTKRDKVFVTTKLMPELITAKSSVDDIMKGIEESLERLNTDHIDCCMIHSVGDPNLGEIDRIQNQNIMKAFQKARDDGKIRFWGASSHGPKMIRDFTWLIENTDINVIMPGMNMMTRGIEPVLAKARKKGVAVVAMKSLSAARKIDYSKYMKNGRTVRQALLKWLLAQPNIDTIAITMRTFEDIDEYVRISGRPEMTPEEKKTLEGYGMLLDHDYCRPGCDHCLHSCMHNVQIADILRYRLYFNNYGREKYAMSLYNTLPNNRKANLCETCIGQCETSCPHHLPIRQKLIQAHTELTI